MATLGGRRPLGRRRRRLYWAVTIVTIAGLLGAFAVYATYRRHRTPVYSPGEDHDAITRQLDRGIPDGAPEPRFTDVTKEAGLDGFRSFQGQRTSQLPEDMGPGAAWGDYDNDGDDDLFLVSAGGPIGAPEQERAPSQLYENLGNGRFALVADFPETRIHGMAAAFGDFNNDGRLDLVISGYNDLLLFRNDDERFVPDLSITAPDGFWASVSWSDFDLDGDLDLYVCGYVKYVPDEAGRDQTSKQYGRDIPYTLNPASYVPENNLLFINEGRKGFREAAESLGVHNPKGRSLAALWHDLDEDGRAELYVANDISDNALFLNEKEELKDISHAAWVADYRGAMGLAFGDWNRDGDDDLFVTHWVAQENALYDSRIEDNDAALRFVDVADQLGLGQIALRSVGWGTEFVDLDADGWQDLVVANGSTFESSEVPNRLVAQPMFLFWNDEGRTFHNLAPLNETLQKPHVSRGLAISDYDQDGDMDILIMDSGEGARLLRNEMRQENWIQLQLLARGPDDDTFLSADGARLEAHVDGSILRRAITGASYLSQSTRIMHFGLGSASKIDSLFIHWPDGTDSQYADLQASGRWILQQGVATPAPAPNFAPPDSPVTTDSTPGQSSREELTAFWKHQRRAMRAMKVDGDCEAAMPAFRAALALNPTHEDSIYYLGNCLAEDGRVEEALQQFAELKRLNPRSHRAFKSWGTLLALEATSEDQLMQARQSLLRAFEINPEAIGAITILAEIDLIQGNRVAALDRLEQILRTNPSAAYVRFLLAYVAWLDDDLARMETLLGQAAADNERWKPAGTVAEGDVRERMHIDQRLLYNAYTKWNPADSPTQAFAVLDNTIRVRSGKSES